MEATRAAGGRIVAVGTTSVRVLETAARRGTATSGWTDLYITPPHRIRVGGRPGHQLPPAAELPPAAGDGLRAARAGTDDPYAARDLVLATYRLALETGYRFFSFGDAMLIV